MRVLTKNEKKAFEIAFDFMDRVCILGYETQSTFNIKVLNDGVTNNLPLKVSNFIHNFGGLSKARKFFNGSKKEKTLPKFIKKLMENKEQPRDYFAKGTLVIETIQVQVIDYQE